MLYNSFFFPISDDCKNIGNILTELLLRGYTANASGSRWI